MGRLECWAVEAPTFRRREILGVITMPMVIGAGARRCRALDPEFAALLAYKPRMSRRGWEKDVPELGAKRP